MYQPTFRISPDLLRLVTLATELKMWVGHAIIDVPWLPTLQQETAVRLAHSSTSIEGNPLTLSDVRALARGEEISATAKSRREVLNSLASMRWLWEKTPETPVHEDELLKLHRILTQGLLPDDQIGSYKNKPNRIINHKGHTIYTPPPPLQAKPLTQELLSWINDPASRNLHPVIAGAIAHHRLVSIHPFMDGNGRISRALEIRLLYTRGFDTHHLFALDEFYEQDRQRYYDKIQQARDLDDDLSNWLEYAAEGLVETLRRTKDRIQSLQVKAKGSKILLSKRQEDALRLMRDKGRVKAPDIEMALKLTRARVGQIVKPLVDAGIVIREGQTRATTYRLA